VPDHRPLPPGSVLPASWSGEGAKGADAADASLDHTRAALDEADRRLFTGLADTHAADAQTRLQLQRIHHEIQSGVAALQPSLDTPAGREQLADLLERKATEAKQVSRDAQEAAERLAANIAAVGLQFESAGGGQGGRETL
jgi:hypothetical protein